MMLDAEVEAMARQLEDDARVLTLLVQTIAEIGDAEKDVTDSVTAMRLARAKSALREVLEIVAP